MTVKKGDIHFRIPEPEKEVIARAAEMAGKGLSEYARDILQAASDYRRIVMTRKNGSDNRINRIAKIWQI